MIRSLIKALREAGFESDDVDVADMLWLAHGMQETHTSHQTADTRETEPARQAAVRTSDVKPHVSEAPRQSHGDGGGKARPRRIKPYAAPSGSVQTSSSVEHIVAPTSPALPERLDIARALRPFKRHRNSDHFTDFDIEATVDRFADTGFLYPVMRPGKERWFDVALVVDESMSMIVWEETVAELVSVFGRQGAFRDVHRWSLSEEDGRAVVRNEAGHPTGIHNVIDPGGRRLILMVTDCVAEFWYRPTIWRLLQQWGKRTPVGILHMLPTRIWPATGLGLANIELRGSQPGAPNSSLHVELPFWQSPPTDNLEPVPIPAISLDAVAIGDWANVTMGSGIVNGRAVVKTWVPGSYPDVHEQEQQLPQELLATFQSRVSIETWELTTYLSVAPLRLGVMRLVQEAMMPGTGHAELAEFLIGGLVRRVGGEQHALDGNDIQFEFVDGVRELLNDAVDQANILKVYRSIAYHLERTEGRAPGFSALILGQDIDAEALPDFLRPFVSVGQGVLQRKGLINIEARNTTLGAQDVVSEAQASAASVTEEDGEPPVWDAALIVGVSHYENLSPLDDPAKTAEQFGDWLFSSPGPGVPPHRVKVLKNPQSINDILLALQELNELLSERENEEKLLVLAFFGHTMTYGSKDYFCLPGFNPDDRANEHLFNPEGTISRLMTDGIWQRYLCIIDGGPDGLIGSEEERLILEQNEPLLQPHSEQRGGLMLSRRVDFRTAFLPQILSALNYDARDVTGRLYGPGLIDHLKEVAYHKTFGGGVDLLLDETSEIVPHKESTRSPPYPGLSAALVVGSGRPGSRFSAGLIATWLLHPEGIDMNPEHVRQVSNPDSLGELTETLDLIDSFVENGATLFVYIAGEVIARDGSIFLASLETTTNSPIDLQKLSQQLSGLKSFTSVVFILCAELAETAPSYLASAVPEFAVNESPRVPVFHFVVRDKKDHTFARSLIGSFSESYMQDANLESVESVSDNMMTTQTLYERITDPQEFLVWFNELDEPIALGPQLSPATVSVRVLSRESVFLCEHGRGRVVLPKGAGPLTESELSDARIEGCTLKGETGRACTRVAGVYSNGVGGEFALNSTSRLVFDTVRVISDGVPATFEDGGDVEEESNAEVLLDEAKYINLVDLDADDLKPRVEQTAQSKTESSKWPVVALAVEMFATRQGAAVLIRRPRLERDAVFLFGLGDSESFKSVMQPRFDLLASRLNENETFKIDVLALSSASEPDVATLTLMLNGMSERYMSKQEPEISIEDLWFDLPGESGSNESETSHRKAVADPSIGRNLMKEMQKLNIPRNRALKSQKTGGWETLYLDGGVSITLLNSNSPDEASNSELQVPNNPVTSTTLFILECQSRRVFLSGNSDFQTIFESFISRSTRLERVDVWQLPSLSDQDRNDRPLDSYSAKAFGVVIADNYLVSGNGRDAIEKTMNLCGELLNARQDSRAFTVHFAFSIDEFDPAFPIRELLSMVDDHPHAQLSFAEAGAGYSSIELLAPMPGQEEQQKHPQ